MELYSHPAETKEGLDKTMSMLYYSRMRFAINLMPLLRASEAAHVISVFGAGLVSSFDSTLRMSQR
jgi:hypothetical protein